MVFPIAAAPAKALWILAGVGVLLVALLGFFGWIAYGSQHASFRVTGDGLRISGDPYGRFVPRADLLVDSASLVSLDRDSPYRPVRKTNGTGLGSYTAGWFRLANGDQGLLFVTDRSRVVRVPTTLGYTVFVSPQDPDGFLAALRGR